MTHTPGPWSNPKWFAIDGPNGQMIATMVAANSLPADVVVANARLIAAAPELLEACLQAATILSPERNFYVSTIALKSAELQLSAAIAKALGQEVAP